MGKIQEPWIYLNGRLVAERQALVSVYDRGFLYGDGVFETLRAYGGKIFKAREHVSRLFQSAKAITLPLPFSPKEVLSILSSVLEANRLKDARLRITLTRGPGEMGLELSHAASPTLVVMARHFPGYSKILYQKGVNSTLVKTRKTPPDSLDPAMKSLNFLNSILAKLEAQACGAFEGILLNQEGHLCEGSVSNLFVVRNGQLLTPSPSCGILAGITRQTVMELASKMGMTIQEGKYRPDEILEAEECFLTNTVIEIMPVVKIEGLAPQRTGHPIGKGKVGPVSQLLLRAYRELVSKS